MEILRQNQILKNQVNFYVFLQIGGNHGAVRMQDVSESPESEVTVKMREDEIKSYP